MTAQNSNNAPRRLFQFGLKTAFVLMTLTAIVLGRELIFVRQRLAFVKAETESGRVPIMASQVEGLKAWHFAVPTIPAWRRWLGDEAYAIIGVPSDSTEEEDVTAARLKKAKELFPEANPFITDEDLSKAVDGGD